MGRVDQGKDGNLAVVVESESDAAQLRATIKASDGAGKGDARCREHRQRNVFSRAPSSPPRGSRSPKRHPAHRLAVS